MFNFAVRCFSVVVLLAWCYTEPFVYDDIGWLNSKVTLTSFECLEIVGIKLFPSWLHWAVVGRQSQPLMVVDMICNKEDSWKNSLTTIIDVPLEAN